MAVLIGLDLSQQKSSPAWQQSIHTIRLLRPDTGEIVMAKEDGQWQMTQPCQLPVNNHRLEPLLEALHSATHEYQASDVDLDAAGLIEPQATVFLNQQSVKLGKTDLRGSRRYTLKNDVVEFVPEWVLSLINGGVTAFAILEPFGLSLTDLQLRGDGIIESEQLPFWQALSAQQIVELQTIDLQNKTPSEVGTAIFGDIQTQLELYQLPEFIALRFADATCAYILAPDALAPITDP